ncbi:hypothetical protein Esti_003407 [Eimeria stiedai]
MDWRRAASLPLFTCLGVLWLLIVSAGLPTDGFAVGKQQKCCLGDALQPVPAASKPLLQVHCVGHPSSARSNLTATSGQPACVTQRRHPTMALFAEGDAGGGGGAPLLLGERSVNRVVLIGRVGLDPDVRQLPSGDRMASFSLATSEQWRDKSTGEVRSRTEWHRVVVFDQGLVDLVEAFVHKGRRLYVDGSLQTRRWVTSDGQERYTTEVLLSKYKGELVLLESPEDRQASRAPAADVGPSNGGLASRQVAGAAALGLRSGTPAGMSAVPVSSQQQLGSSARAPRYALPVAHSEPAQWASALTPFGAE